MKSFVAEKLLGMFKTNAGEITNKQNKQLASLTNKKLASLNLQPRSYRLVI